MEVEALTLLVLELNRLIDSGKHDDISIGDVQREVRERNLLPFLKGRTDIQASMFLGEHAFPGFEKFFNDRMEGILGGYGDGAKWGVSRRGLCLALAWTNEIIQQGEGLTWGPGKTKK